MRQVQPSPHVSACSFTTLRPNLVLAHGIPHAFPDDVHSYIPSTAIGSVPSLPGQAIAYRWRSLPSVRRHRAGSPQGSSNNGCCCLFRYHHVLINVNLFFFSRPLLVQKGGAASPPRLAVVSIIAWIFSQVMLYVSNSNTTFAQGIPW